MSRKRIRNPKQAVIYLRVSSEKQAVSGLGLADQDKRCRAYCEMLGLEVVGVFRDENVSAGKPLSKRPAGVCLLNAVRNSSVGAVVTLKLDRVFRSALDALTTVEAWQGENVAFHMIDFGGAAIDTSTPIGKMFLTMIAGFAEFERSLIADRTRSAMQIKRANGQRVGHIPYGRRLNSDGKTLEDCPEERKCLDLMCHFYQKCKSLRTVTTVMNTMGYDNRGNPWTKSAVHRLLARAESN